MKFENIIMRTQKELKKALVRHLKNQKYNVITKDGFIFCQGSIPVLLVAHMDTVHKTPVKDICYSNDRNIVMSPQGIGGDDRCGIFMILEIIKKLNCSILFCEDEEIGCVGAKKFVESKIKPKNINYIIEIDRKGSDDAVFYDCDNPEFTEFVVSGGFKEEYGSYSDISEIAPYLGIAAVNISSGYYNAHCTHEYINMKDVLNNIYKISKLIETKTKMFEYIESVKYTKYFGKGFSYNFKDDWFDDYFLKQNVKSKVEKLPFEGYDFEVETELLMPVYGNGWVVNDKNELDEGFDFYINEYGETWRYDWNDDVCYYEGDIQAKNFDNGSLKFNEEKAIPMEIIIV